MHFQDHRSGTSQVALNAFVQLRAGFEIKDKERREKNHIV